MITADEYHKQLTSIQASFAAKPLAEQVQDVTHIIVELRPVETSLDKQTSLEWLKSEENKAICAAIYTAINNQENDAAGNHDYLKGWLRYNGVGTEENKQAGAQHYRAAAAKGHKMAQFNMGVCYAYGVGVEKEDAATAIGFFTASAEQGYAPAQFYLGCHLAQEMNAEGDLEKGILLLTSSAAQGHSEAPQWLEAAKEMQTEIQQSAAAARAEEASLWPQAPEESTSAFTLTLTFHPVRAADSAASCALLQDHLAPLIAAENEPGVSLKPLDPRSFAITYPERSPSPSSHAQRLEGRSASSPGINR